MNLLSIFGYSMCLLLSIIKLIFDKENRAGWFCAMIGWLCALRLAIIIF